MNCTMVIQFTRIHTNKENTTLVINLYLVNNNTHVIYYYTMISFVAFLIICTACYYLLNVKLHHLLRNKPHEPSKITRNLLTHIKIIGIGILVLLFVNQIGLFDRSTATLILILGILISAVIYPAMVNRLSGIFIVLNDYICIGDHIALETYKGKVMTIAPDYILIHDSKGNSAKIPHRLILSTTVLIHK